MVSRAVERFASDCVLVVGGARAILLQVADPVVAAGVARHSDFAHRPVERLRNTLTFAYAVVLGTPSDASAVVRHVGRAHAPVSRADEAERQLWVAATLYDTAALVHEVVYGELAKEVATEALREYSRLGTSLDMPLSLWPATPADFDAYFVKRVSGLTVGADARQIAHDLFSPTTAPSWLRAGIPLARLLTIDLLPASVRRAYGFRFGPLRRWQARQAWRVIRLVAYLLPAR
ncbi:MAG TPA: oxygenase MpaB family protein, partial [Humibacter sp.]|nr:oxygenase MpaB family protein [Humibacter sp.]